jgi:hypothetical protein
MAGLVRVINHRGKKGDTIKIPTPTRGSVSTKAAETQVTLIQHGTDNGLTLSIDRHVEYSRLIEDIVDIQALESLRRFYTDDAGYAIAVDVDTQLILEAADVGFNSLVVSSGVIDSTSTLTLVLEGDGSTWDQKASTDISDQGIRAFIKRLDDNDVPMSGRVMVVPTIVKYDLLGTARFTETQYVGDSGGSNTIRNGLIGDVYGMPVYVTTNLPVVEDDEGNADNVLGLVFQRDGIVLLEQAGVRSQTQYKQEYLADLFTADMLYGTGVVRPTNVINFVVPTS